MEICFVTFRANYDDFRNPRCVYYGMLLHLVFGRLPSLRDATLVFGYKPHLLIQVWPLGVIMTQTLWREGGRAEGGAQATSTRWPAGKKEGVQEDGQWAGGPEKTHFFSH